MVSLPMTTGPNSPEGSGKASIDKPKGRRKSNHEQHASSKATLMLRLRGFMLLQCTVRKFFAKKR